MTTRKIGGSIASPNRLQPFPAQTIEAVAGILGATEDGLTNTEIANILAAKGINDPVAEASKAHALVRAGLAYVPMSKRERIRRALASNQEKTGTGNALVAFITHAMNPQRYVQTPAIFEDRRQLLDEVLVFVGLRVTDQGKVARAQRATTLSEAAELGWEAERGAQTPECPPVGHRVLHRGSARAEYLSRRPGGHQGCVRSPALLNEN